MNSTNKQIPENIVLTENGADCDLVQLEENISFLHIVSPLSSGLTRGMHTISEVLKFIEIIESSQPQNFLLKSDSLSDLRAPGNQEDESLLFGILAQLQHSIRSITIAWIPGHSGIIGYETPDNIA